MTSKPKPKSEQSKKGAVELTEAEIDSASAGAVTVKAGYFKGVDGLNAELREIEFQDGTDLFLPKRHGK